MDSRSFHQWQWRDTEVKGQGGKGPAVAMQQPFPVGPWEPGLNIHKVFLGGSSLPAHGSPTGRLDAGLRQSLVARLLVKGRAAAMVGERLSPPLSSPSEPLQPPQPPTSQDKQPPHEKSAENGDVMHRESTHFGDATTERLHREVVTEIEQILRDPPPPPGPGQESGTLAWKCRFCPFSGESSRQLYSHYQFHHQLLTSAGPLPHLEWIMAFRNSRIARDQIPPQQTNGDGNTGNGDKSQGVQEQTMTPVPLTTQTCIYNDSTPKTPVPLQTINGLKDMLKARGSPSPSASSYLRQIVKTVIKDGNPGKGPTSISAYNSMVGNYSVNPSHSGSQDRNGVREMHEDEPPSKRHRCQSPSSPGKVEEMRHRQTHITMVHEGAVATVAPQTVPVTSPPCDSMVGLQAEKGHLLLKTPETFTAYPPGKHIECGHSLDPDDTQPLDMTCSAKHIKSEPAEKDLAYLSRSSRRRPFPVGAVTSVQGGTTISPMSPMSPMSPPYTSPSHVNGCPVHYPPFLQRSPTTITPRFTNSGLNIDCPVHPTTPTMVSSFAAPSIVGNPLSPQRSASTSSTLSNTSEDTSIYRQGRESDGTSCQNSPPGSGVMDCAVKPIGHRRQQQDQSVQCDLLSAQDQNRKCFYCGISFEDDVVYSIHMGTHNHLEPFICNICGYHCENKYGFNTHIMRGHFSVSRIS